MQSFERREPNKLRKAEPSWRRWQARSRVVVAVILVSACGTAGSPGQAEDATTLAAQEDEPSTAVQTEAYMAAEGQALLEFVGFYPMAMGLVLTMETQEAITECTNLFNLIVREFGAETKYPVPLIDSAEGIPDAELAVAYSSYVSTALSAIGACIDGDLETASAAFLAADDALAVADERVEELLEQLP